MNASWWQELKRRNVVRVGIAYTVVGWIVAQIGLTLFETFEAPGWVGKVALALIVLGLPFALLFAWAFELTPEGLKRSHEVDLAESITQKTGRKFDFAIIAALAIAVAWLGWDKFANRSNEATRPSVAAVSDTAGALPVGDGNRVASSIAVLPFADMSPEGDQEYFSDGISEELLNLLARIPDLKVAARTSSFAFKGRHEDVSQIADKLNVSKILEGSVRKAGTRLRITAQLIEADTGYHLWSNTYDRELDDVFAIQDDIAAAIVGALQQTLGLSTVAPAITRSGNVDAYNAYLEGRFLMEKRGEGPLRQAREAFDKAIALDPDYAPAYAAQAETILLLRDSSQTYGDIPTTEALALARPLVDRAMVLAPGSPDVHAAHGFLLSTEGRHEESVAAFDRALALSPNLVRVILWRAQSLQDLGRIEESFEGTKKAVSLDPLAYVPAQNLAVQYASRGRYDEALATAENLARVRNDAVSWRGAVAMVNVIGGRLDRAHAALKKAQALEPDDYAVGRFLYWTYSMLDLDEQARQLEFRPIEKVYRLMSEERWDDALAAVKPLVAGEPTNEVRDAVAAIHFERGDMQACLAALQHYVDRTEGNRGDLFEDARSPRAFLLIAALQNSGDNAAARQWQDRLWERHRMLRKAGNDGDTVIYTEVKLHTIDGETGEALRLLRELVDRQWILVEPERDIIIRRLEDNPAFQQIVADHKRTKDRQRNNVLAQLTGEPETT